MKRRDGVATCEEGNGHVGGRVGAAMRARGGSDLRARDRRGPGRGLAAARAAELLDMNANTLRSRLRALDIEIERAEGAPDFVVQIGA